MPVPVHISTGEHIEVEMLLERDFAADRESLSLADELLTTRQAAKVLNVSPKTLERMRVEGQGPKYVKLGRAVRYRLSDLQQYIQDNLYLSTSEYGRLSRGGGRGIAGAARR